MFDPADHQNLDEGSLYVYKKGVLQEIQTDPDDLMRKIKITPDAFAVATALQNKLRKSMSGYRPDISTVCSSLIKHAGASDDAITIVRLFALSLFKEIEDEEKP